MGDGPVLAVRVSVRVVCSLLVLICVFSDGVTPYAEVVIPVVAAHQPYDISLHLNIPTTPANLELGNFMTTLTILSTNNQTVAFIRRPVTTSPSSLLVIHLTTHTVTCNTSHHHAMVLHIRPTQYHQCRYTLALTCHSRNK